MPADIQVEVVFARADRQCLVAVTVPQNSTVADAIAASGIASSFPDEDLVNSLECNATLLEARHQDASMQQRRHLTERRQDPNIL